MIVPLSKNRLRSVIDNMRPRDQQEFFATIPEDSIDIWVAGMCSLERWSYCMTDNAGEPVAAGGFFPMWDGVYQSWMFSTENVRINYFQLLRYARNKHKEILAEDTHRIYCHTLYGHEYAEKFLKYIGYRLEGVHKSYGMHGEDFGTWAILRD